MICFMGGKGTFDILARPIGWSEPVDTSALAQDEAVQAILGMNQKHILFPYPWIF